jgi:transposase
VCSCCGKEVFTIYDSRIRRLRDLSVFELATYLVVSRRRVLCPSCGVKVEELKWAEAYQRCTIRFAEYVAKLCELLPVKQVAEVLGLNWKTVKEIDKQALKGRFGQPDYSGLRLLAVDEISYKKHHKYLTIVLDLERTRVVWVGEGRSKETLDRFFKEIGPERAEKIVAIAIDMWDPFLASIKEHAPQAVVVFDKFHVIASYSRVIDKVRNEEYRKATEAKKAGAQGHQIPAPEKPREPQIGAKA